MDGFVSSWRAEDEQRQSAVAVCPASSAEVPGAARREPGPFSLWWSHTVSKCVISGFVWGQLLCDGETGQHLNLPGTCALEPGERQIISLNYGSFSSPKPAVSLVLQT